MFLETVAGVPGMVGAMVRHLRSLRHMDRDHGWIHTLLGVCVCVCVCVCVYFLFYIHVVLKNSINLHGKLMSWYVIDHTLVVGDYVIVCNPKSQLCTTIAR